MGIKKAHKKIEIVGNFLTHKSDEWYKNRVKEITEPHIETMMLEIIEQECPEVLEEDKK